MNNRFIMTAFGKDRPGIVSDVTRILFENGCNLEDTSMTLLADEFALILLFGCKDSNIGDILARECRRLEREKGISAFLRALDQPRKYMPAPSFDCSLHVEGLDQAGIVYKISQFLADHQVNIVDLKSVVQASPQFGTPLYVMDIKIQIPPGMSANQVEAGLTAVADDLNVDISVIS